LDRLTSANDSGVLIKDVDESHFRLGWYRNRVSSVNTPYHAQILEFTRVCWVIRKKV